MVNKKLGIDGRNDTTHIFRIKEAAAELCVFDVADWRCFHDGFCIIANEADGHRVDTTYRISVCKSQTRSKYYSYFQMLLRPLSRQQDGNSQARKWSRRLA
jgi:hypothetical protein